MALSFFLNSLLCMHALKIDTCEINFFDLRSKYVSERHYNMHFNDYWQCMVLTVLMHHFFLAL